MLILTEGFVAMKQIIETLFQDADDIARKLPEQIHSSSNVDEGKIFFKEFEDTNERLEILYKGSGVLALKSAHVKVIFPTNSKLDKHGNLNMTIIEITKDSASILDGKKTHSITTYFEGNLSLEASQIDISKTVNGIEIAKRMIDDVIQNSEIEESS